MNVPLIGCCAVEVVALVAHPYPVDSLCQGPGPSPRTPARALAVQTQEHGAIGSGSRQTGETELRKDFHAIGRERPTIHGPGRWARSPNSRSVCVAEVQLIAVTEVVDHLRPAAEKIRHYPDLVVGATAERTSEGHGVWLWAAVVFHGKIYDIAHAA